MKYILLTLTLLANVVNVSAESRIEGIWEGAFKMGSSMRLVFHFTETDGVLSGKMDSPDQGVKGIACKEVKMIGDTLFIDMSNMGIKYNGILNKDNTITGAWRQNGAVVPLDLKKTDKPTELDRPQMPKEPFSYTSEDLSFQNADKSITYGATITIPEGKGSFPAVLLISGSGPQNRDEELMGHKPFLVIADYLTKKGYIVLRVDDRGVGKTTGDGKNATSADFANDVMAGIDYLKTRKEVNSRKIGLMGHSEGGLIAPMVASQRKDVNFIILMAGPGVKIPQLMAEQNAAILKSNGLNDTVIKEYIGLYNGMVNAIVSSATGVDAKNKMITVLTNWKATASAEALEFTGLKGQGRDVEYIDGFMEIFHDKWFSYFLRSDPQPYLQKLSCKVLALNGDKDVQVISKSNLEGIRQSLAKSKVKVSEVKELPGLNHLFQQCKSCNSNEYGALTETINPVALQTVGDWLDKNVK